MNSHRCLVAELATWLVQGSRLIRGSRWGATRGKRPRGESAEPRKLKLKRQGEKGGATQPIGEVILEKKRGELEESEVGEEKGVQAK